MFCMLMEDVFVRVMYEWGFLLFVIVFVVQYCMGGWDWCFVLIFDI